MSAVFEGVPMNGALFHCNGNITLYTIYNQLYFFRYAKSIFDSSLKTLIMVVDIRIYICILYT